MTYQHVTDDGTEQLHTLVSWQHRRRGEQAHCLARVHGGSNPVVVFSELAANPSKLAVSTDVCGAAEALSQQLAKAGWPPLPPETLWVLHHGDFSRPAPDVSGAGETFTQVAPRWDASGCQDDPSEHVLLDRQRSDDLARRLELAPVSQALALAGDV